MGLSRRMFLQRGSMAVALAGVTASMPLLSEVAPEPPAPEAGSLALEATEASWLTQDLVAHVRDVGTGEISMYLGERQIVLNDPGLARALFQATR